MKKFIILMFVFIMSLISVNAVTTLTTCGEPVGGWTSNEHYVIDVDNVNSTSSPDSKYCFDLYLETGLHDIIFEYDSVNTFGYIELQNDYSLFRTNSNSSEFTFKNWRFQETGYATARPMFLDIYNLNGMGKGVDINMSYHFVDMWLEQESSYTATNFIEFDVSGNGVAYVKGWTFDNVNFLTDDYVFRFIGSKSFSSGVYNYESSTFLYYDLLNSNFMSENKIDYYNIPTITYCGGAFCSSTYYAIGSGGQTFITGNNFAYINKNNNDYSGSTNAQLYPAKSTILSAESNNYVSSWEGSDATEIDLFGYKIYDTIADINPSTLGNSVQIIMSKGEVLSFTNSIDLNSYGSVLDLSYGIFSFSTIYSIDLFYNSLDCLTSFGTSCSFTDSGNAQITGFSESGIITISSNHRIKGIDFSQTGTNDASIISHNVGIAQYEGISLLNNILSRIYPSDLSSIYQKMVDLRVDNLFIDNNIFSSSGASHEYNIITNYGDDTLITNNDFIVNSANGYNDVANIFVQGTSTVIKDNTFTYQGNANSDVLRYGHWFDIIGNNVEVTNNIFTNSMTNVVEKSRVFNNVAGGYFYHNWLDNNMIITMDNYTTLNINKQVGYEFGGRVYTFTIGNYYDGYSNICADVNSDGFCDTPYVLPNGQTDNNTLKEYPYNFETQLLFAENFFDFDDFIVESTNIADNGDVVITDSNSPLVIQYQHTASIDMTCDMLLDNSVIDIRSISGNSIQTINQGNWSYDKIYDLEIICHSGANIERSSGLINFIIKSTGTTTTPPPSGGGGGGGDSSDDGDSTVQCVDGATQSTTCSDGEPLDLLICEDNTWIETGNNCESCLLGPFLCNEEPVIIDGSFPTEPIFSESPIEEIINKVIVKKICDIKIEPESLMFTESGIQDFKIINNEQASYSPDYKFVNAENYDSAKQSLSITNELGTMQPNEEKQVGIKFEVGTYTPITSVDKLVLTHSECADVELEISTATNPDELLLNGRLGGGSYNLPNLRPVSELFNTTSLIDYGLYGLIGGGFWYSIRKKVYYKGKKNKSKNNIIKLLIVGMMTFFVSIVLLSILNILFA